MRELDYFGELLLNVFAFIDAGFDTSMTVEDSVLSESVEAGVFFENINNRFHVRSASLPGDPAICAVAFDTTALMLEISPVDVAKVEELIVNGKHPFTFRAKRREFLDANGRLVFSISGVSHQKFEGITLPPRAMAVIPLKGLDKLQRGQVIELIDQMFTVSVFKPIPDNSLEVSLKKPELRMEINMSLMHTLELVQRPMLSIRGVGTVGWRQSQQMGIQQLLSLQHAISRMSRAELEEYTKKEVAKRGEGAVLRAFLFVIAGRIKSAKPTLTWKQARKLADKMTSRVASAQ